MDNRENKLITKKIRVWGIVQGVGFRPFVYHMAQKNNIKGTVKNIGGVVEIVAQSHIKDFNNFLYDIKTNEDNKGEIVHIEIEDVKEDKFNGFNIIESDVNDEVSIIPPDISICQKCEEELLKVGDRRFKNPFISCAACGPRYTIIEKLPYDRDNTTMKDFEMCSSCRKEYTSPDSRRFHAQTISCNDCGPYLIFDNLTDENAFEKAVDIINSGGIIGVKGIGGYHFSCSPFMESTVENLRKLKGREEKPFAVMFPDINSIEEYCFVSNEEKDLLQSKARPIVLLYRKNESMAYSTNKGSIYCGAFLPYTPLHIMLTKKCGPLIMTSANISGKSIIKDDSEILHIDSPYLQGVLYNKRKILRSVDDSVSKIIDKKPQLIRRSRGYVPYPIFLPKNKKLQIFAAGSDLKAAFCLYKNGSAVVSQYFGDLEEKTVLDRYKESVKDLSKLMKIQPNMAVCDLHPNYFSSKYAKTLRIPLVYVQHHHAHIASVMAEHNLKERVIGVAFDGTGYGTDGNIWGGEFLVCNGSDFQRKAHLSYTPILGGDDSMKDGRKTATCFLISSDLREYIKDDRSDIIEAAIKNNINTVLSSSMGRLFDAVSSILNIQHENHYEGQCAIELEKEAFLAKKKNVKIQRFQFSIKENSRIIEIDPKPVLEDICRLRENEDKGSLALGFHYAVADLILNVCQIIRDEEKVNTVALSGGVFQNTILLEEALKILREKGFNVYINRKVPPNDGCISLGQTFIGLMR
ncbi:MULTISPECIES: carbamoyltransferase HypF [Clostridium]|uniref:Carbamoyltransferase n=1 Tax=Clostridium colicanis DSM 13634 TaxID=1121305 RepID=A0A151ARE6_9CLOT|nr:MULTISPECIES: carbamoyltransferase HypF [Clostridium]KYH30221.1 carbamoyltransferase HypF [Clostridium colicanis DSM 13634]MBE6044549.1 carbamoyltransferase HypF [Clostridium thermopalmarium]